MDDACKPACPKASGRPEEPPPVEAGSSDPEILRAALIRESSERRRAECRAMIQTKVANLALDLLVREPDIQSFFGEFTKTIVELGGNHACGVWLIDDDQPRCDLWMAYVADRMYAPGRPDWDTLTLPRESMARHLFDHKAGWTSTVEYRGDDPQLPEPVRAFNRDAEVQSVAVTPLLLGSRTLGWLALSTYAAPGPDEWWRVAVLEAVARQATLTLHQHRVAERGRLEERHKAVLEERNRLARDIHDNLAQGFAAILMQLQAAQREACALPAAVSVKLDTAVELARTHLNEARRSVGALRPNVGQGEDVSQALRRIADLAQRTTNAPIELRLDALPRFGDNVEREIVSIAQEALNNAVRHSRAQRIRIHASSVRSIGLRLSVADDGRGITRERTTGFGMTSMQERAERIGASLTIVTAPRSGTEVVLAWEPASLPTQIHATS
jgi:signal transduction histidine kinase